MELFRASTSILVRIFLIHDGTLTPWGVFLEQVIIIKKLLCISNTSMLNLCIPGIKPVI